MKHKLLFLIFSFNLINGISFFSSDLNDSTKKVGFIFAHGLGGDKEQVNWYAPNNSVNWYILQEPYFTFNFHEVYKPNEINFAQQKDIDALAHAHRRFEGEQKIAEVVLIGLSRGAACILNYAASRPANLKALVVESPFDSIENVIKYQLKKKSLSWIPWSHQIGCGIYRSLYPTYNKNGIKPIDCVKNIDKNLPILFIHSNADTLIPTESSESLYNILKQNGHKHVYLLKLDSGAHANYQFAADAKKYQTTVHAFYHRYGIPHNAILSLDGVNYLNNCRP